MDNTNITFLPHLLFVLSTRMDPFNICKPDKPRSLFLERDKERGGDVDGEENI
jgi:hypothetical protein